VSSLKKSASDSRTEDSGLGIENGAFQWNVVDAKEDMDKAKASSPTTEETTITVEGPDESPLENDHKFELKDISVMFPEGELTVIAGPTASGKTALLVRSVSITGPSH
jgi:ABC-type transport system involved in cytochrome bd biosynthesis fused ATPase/permease subunit